MYVQHIGKLKLTFTQNITETRELPWWQLYRTWWHRKLPCNKLWCHVGIMITFGVQTRSALIPWDMPICAIFYNDIELVSGHRDSGHFIFQICPRLWGGVPPAADVKANCLEIMGCNSLTQHDEGTGPLTTRARIVRCPRTFWGGINCREYH